MVSPDCHGSILIVILMVTIQELILYIRTQRHKETKILYRYKDNKRLKSRHKGLQRQTLWTL